MKELFNEQEFNNSKSKDLLPLECYHCHEPFYRKKKEIKFIRKTPNRNIFFCSYKCNKEHNKNGKNLNCTNCGESFYRCIAEINKSKSGNHFCSKSCAITHRNKNNPTHTRRSKLEAWLEEQLTELYPNLDIEFNDKETIGSELDIYIPSLNVAFELNGIFHYEPIYGNDKLRLIQENDQSKSKACHDAMINLCVIDTSQQKYFKPKTSKKYLNIITTIINQRTLLNS